MILFYLLACTPAAPAPDTLFAAALEASGGEAALRSHQTMTISGVMTFRGQGVSAAMVEYLKAPGESWSVLDYPGLGIFESGVREGLAWANDPVGGPRLLEGAERQQAIRSADFFAAANWRTHFPDRQTLGKLDRKGRETWEVLSHTPDGKEVYHFFDAVTHLEVALSSTAAGGGKQAHTDFSRWVTFDDVLLPTRIEDTSATGSTVFEIGSVAWDRPDFPAFVLPDDVAALVDAAP